MANATALISILLFAIVIVLMTVLVIIAVKANKKLKTNLGFGDKSLNIQMENDTPNQKVEVIEKPLPIQTNPGLDEELVKQMVISSIESHVLITDIFNWVVYKDDISDKIFYKIIKNECSTVFDTRTLDIQMKITQKLYKFYIENIKTKVLVFIDFVKQNIDDFQAIIEKIDEFTANFSNEEFIDNVLFEFKARKQKITLSDKTTYIINGNKDNAEELENILNEFKTKTFNNITIISNLKRTKALLYSVTNKYVKYFTLLNTMDTLLDNILRYIFDIYFECKPAVLGNIEGV